MQILKNAGSFVILTPKKELRAQLLRFVEKILRSGHESVIEHSNMTVQFNNVSRGFTDELICHCPILLGISQKSTRYVDYAKKEEEPDLEKFQIKCVVPPHRNENEKVVLEDGRTMSISEMFAEYEAFYRALRKAGWEPQDARQVLPIGIKSQIVVSANFREWRRIFTVWTQKTAYWEIRKVMGDLLEKVQNIVPLIFNDFIEAGKDRNGLRYFRKRPWDMVVI